MERGHDSSDGRRVVLRTTKKGRRVLRALSEDHARELHELAPALVQTLTRIGDIQRESASVDVRGVMRGKGR